jgi:energy-coupling factor transporter transmembrane protein EcfT
MTVNNWISANTIWITLAIAIIVLLYFIFAIIQTARKKRRFVSQINIILLILGLLFLIFLTYHANEIEGADWGQVILMIGLVSVTAVYASSTEKQAEASVKMADEMREQRIMNSRPVIIQKAVHKHEGEIREFGPRGFFLHFELHNVWSGPAIEVEISLLNKEKQPIYNHRESFLRVGETPIKFHLNELARLEESAFYLVAEYKSIIFSTQQPMWYQTWLPFEIVKSSEKGTMYVKPGELKFYDEVTEKDRIDAFHSRSKPK